MIPPAMSATQYPSSPPYEDNPCNKIIFKTTFVEPDQRSRCMVPLVDPDPRSGTFLLLDPDPG